MSSTAALRRPLAVVSDGSGSPEAVEETNTAPSGLLSAAALLRDSAGIDAAAVLVTVDSSARLIAELVTLARDFAAIYLMRTEPARAKDAQLALRGTAPVITDRQTTAIAMTAALLTTLARAGLSPHAAQEQCLRPVDELGWVVPSRSS